METTQVLARQSKYCSEILHVMGTATHATNQELLSSLRLTFPEVSATTIHRATARLADRGQLGMAPAAHDGSMRYDVNPLPHDHFQCSVCYRLRDADFREKVIDVIRSSIPDCEIGGRLVITGVCKDCKNLTETSSDAKPN
ncbi:transcriptional repressor [Candidatus Saccharibacteria bacterium]|nr:transcriptional repressor [Candidatus Saccharibacteria bacterium]